MSCSSCYNKAVDSVCAHQFYSPKCHRRTVQRIASYCGSQQESHHCCCSGTSYCSPSHHHLPNVASPLHISHPSPHSHTPPQTHPHYTNHLTDIYRTPPTQHHRMMTQPHTTHTYRSQRELIPSPSNICPSSQYASDSLARPLMQTPTNRTHPSINPAFVCPNTRIEFSPINSSEFHTSGPFRLAYDEDLSAEGILVNQRAHQPVSRESSHKSERNRLSDQIQMKTAEPLRPQNSVWKRVLRPQKSIELSDDSDLELTSIADTRSKVDTLAPTYPDTAVTCAEKKLPRRDRKMKTRMNPPSLPPNSDSSTLEDVVVMDSEETKTSSKTYPLVEAIHSFSETTEPAIVEQSLSQDAQLIDDLPPEFTSDNKVKSSKPLSKEPKEERGKTVKEGESADKPVVLCQWFLDIFPPDHIVVLGYKEEDLAGSQEPALWQSGPIVERVTNRLLRTEHGTIYLLKGVIIQKLMGPGCEYAPSLSKYTIKKFKNGFPKCWKALVFPKTPTTPIEDGTTQTKVKKEPSLLHTPTNSIVEPLNIKSGFLSSLKRSSRGRTLKPSMSSLSPYLQTSMDIYSYDVYGNFQGLVSPCIDLTLSDVEGRSTPMHGRKRFKKEIKRKEDEEAVIPPSKSTAKTSLHTGANRIPDAVTEETDSQGKLSHRMLETPHVTSGYDEHITEQVDNDSDKVSAGTEQSPSSQESPKSSKLGAINSKSKRGRKPRISKRYKPSQKDIQSLLDDDSSKNNNVHPYDELHTTKVQDNRVVVRKSPKKKKKRANFHSTDESDIDIQSIKQSKAQYRQSKLHTQPLPPLNSTYEQLKDVNMTCSKDEVSPSNQESIPSEEGEHTIPTQQLGALRKNSKATSNIPGDKRRSERNTRANNPRSVNANDLKCETELTGEMKQYCLRARSSKPKIPSGDELTTNAESEPNKAYYLRLNRTKSAKAMVNEALKQNAARKPRNSEKKKSIRKGDQPLPDDSFAPVENSNLFPFDEPHTTTVKDKNPVQQKSTRKKKIASFLSTDESDVEIPSQMQPSSLPYSTCKQLKDGEDIAQAQQLSSRNGKANYKLVASNKVGTSRSPRSTRAKEFPLGALQPSTEDKAKIKQIPITNNTENSTTAQDSTIVAFVAKPLKLKTPKGKGKKRTRVCYKPKRLRVHGSSVVTKKILEDCEYDSVDGWTPERITLLKRTVREVPALRPDFWQEVANRLQTGHSPTECSTKYMELCTKPSTTTTAQHKQTMEPEKTEDGKILITGKIGTMKRKRQLRAAMEYTEKGYVDDIFDSTPFKKRVKTKVKLREWSDESEPNLSTSECEEEWLDTPNPARRRVGAPRVVTPKLCELIMTPDLESKLTRETADNVMYQIQKAKQRTKPQSLKSDVTPTQRKTHFSEQKLQNIRTGEMRVLRMFEDTDEESSDGDPFSDIDETYKDLLSRVD